LRAISSSPNRFLAVLALAALAGCASFGSGEHCAPAAAPRTAAPDGRLALLTWNVHGLPFDDSVPPRMEAIAREIRARQPDVVLLQEAWLDVEAARLGCGLAADYDRVPDAPGVRSGFLGAFGHRRAGLIAFVRRASPWRVEAEPMPALIEYTQSSPWYRYEHLDGVAGKGVQRFTMGDGARRVLVLQTHAQTQYPKGGYSYEAIRRSQIAELLAQAHAAPPSDTVIVAGDFNVREDEAPLYGALTAELEDLTAAYRRSCGDCGTFIGQEGAETWWIDYVMAGRNVPVKATRVDRVRNRGRDDPFSDHHGVWVELELR
jgi:endonuclease/exonuclease/phosphatase family metal-dependent hydrolase